MKERINTKPSIRYVNEVIKLIEKYGMPTVSFGFGIFLMIRVYLKPDLGSDKILSTGFMLVLLGLIVGVWMQIRNNPIERKPDRNEIQVEQLLSIIRELMRKNNNLNNTDI